MNCKICNSIHFFPVIEVKEMMFGSRTIYPYVQCAACLCLQLVNQETNENKKYPVQYYSFNTYQKNTVKSRIKRFIIKQSVAKALGEANALFSVFAQKERQSGAHALKGKIKITSSILDVGCGDGKLIEALSGCGYQHLKGIDPYLEKDVFRNKYSLLRKNIGDMPSDEKFDVIMMHHSFEHMDDPFETIGHVGRLLNPRGVCIIRIPVADSYVFEKYKEHWVQLDAPRHIFLHSNASMKLIAEKKNMKIAAIVDDSTAFQFIGSEQYLHDIPLDDSRSFFVTPLKKTPFNKKHLFSRKEIKSFHQKATELNQIGKGDQRIFYLTKD